MCQSLHMDTDRVRNKPLVVIYSVLCATCIVCVSAASADLTEEFNALYENSSVSFLLPHAAHLFSKHRRAKQQFTESCQTGRLI